MNKQISERVMPINSFIAATEPLGDRAEEVLTLCHLVLLKRPGEVRLPEAVAELRTAHLSWSVPASPAGCILEAEDRMPSVSATDIRARIAAGSPVEHLLPAGVLSYIRQQGLYS